MFRGGSQGISDLEYETAHPGTSRQHEEDVRKQHEVALILLLLKIKKRDREVWVDENFTVELIT